MKFTQPRLTPHLAMLLATAIVASGMTAGCMADESAPSRPRTQNILAPDEKAKDNAEHRALEEPKRELPTTGGSELPGQSRANPAPPAPGEASVITADAGSMSIHNFRAPSDDYNNNNYASGPVPALNEKVGQTPTPGSTPVPGTAWSVEHYWGEIAPLDNYPHRAWPDEHVAYAAADVKHDPTYYFNLQDQLPIPKNNGTYGGNAISAAIEFPWFFVNTAALPILMVLEPPFSQRTTERLSQNSVYLGHLPSGGDIIPSPTPGVIKWEYPFLQKESRNPNDPTYNEPATTQMQEIPPIMPAPPAPSVPDATTPPGPNTTTQPQ